MTDVLKSIGLKPLHIIEKIKVAVGGLRWAVVYTTEDTVIIATFAHRCDADEYANYRNKPCARFTVREID